MKPFLCFLVAAAVLGAGSPSRADDAIVTAISDIISFAKFQRDPVWRDTCAPAPPFNASYRSKRHT